LVGSGSVSIFSLRVAGCGAAEGGTTSKVWSVCDDVGVGVDVGVAVVVVVVVVVVVLG
jgi:hypothetical protein